MEHDIPFGNSNRENGTTFLDFPLFLGIFQWDEPTKRIPFTAETEIPEILTKWKAPMISAVCQGLLSCRRHIGKREDPGDEVGSDCCSIFSRNWVRSKKPVYPVHQVSVQ